MQVEEEVVAREHARQRAVGPSGVGLLQIVAQRGLELSPAALPLADALHGAEEEKRHAHPTLVDALADAIADAAPATAAAARRVRGCLCVWRRSWRRQPTISISCSAPQGQSNTACNTAAGVEAAGVEVSMEVSLEVSRGDEAHGAREGTPPHRLHVVPREVPNLVDLPPVERILVGRLRLCPGIGAGANG